MSTPPKGTITAAGFSLPTFDEVRAYLVSRFQAIYGADIYLGNDSQDGQLLSLFAQMIHDCNSLGQEIWASFDPQASSGVPLSRVVKVNGLERRVPTYSVAVLRVVGVWGLTVLAGALAEDDQGFQWVLPEFTIPVSGEIAVTATCTTIGAIRAPAGSINRIATPTAGWQEVSNPAEAAVGAPVESDAQLRIRQRVSTMIPSTSPLGALIGALASLPNLTFVKVYENDTDLPDAYGIPRKSLAVVVSGGDVHQIADVIAQTKTQGVATYGRFDVVSENTAGVPDRIFMSVRNFVFIDVELTVRARDTFTLDIQASLQQAVAAWISALDLGQTVELPKLWIPAQLSGGQNSETFELLNVRIARHGGALALANLTMAYDDQPAALASNVTVVVVP